MPDFRNYLQHPNSSYNLLILPIEAAVVCICGSKFAVTNLHMWGCDGWMLQKSISLCKISNRLGNCEILYGQTRLREIWVYDSFWTDIKYCTRPQVLCFANLWYLLSNRTMPWYKTISRHGQVPSHPTRWLPLLSMVVLLSTGTVEGKQGSILVVLLGTGKVEGDKGSMLAVLLETRRV